MIKIVQQKEPILRDIAKEVPVADIISDPIQNILKDMKKALESQEDGVAIAAPQISVPLRNYKKQKIKPEKDLVFINPVITKISKSTSWMEEGCLSVRYLYGKVKRSTKATVMAYDENGNKFERGGSGIMAQIFQHETDHLDGILFIDKAKDLEDIPPQEKK